MEYVECIGGGGAIEALRRVLAERASSVVSYHQLVFVFVCVIIIMLTMTPV